MSKRENKNIIQNETFVSLSFKRLAQVGEVNIIHSAFLWSQIKIKRYPQFWGAAILLQNEKPCSVFKPIAYRETSFSQNCEKGCPTVVQLQLMGISPWWSNLDMYTLHI